MSEPGAGPVLTWTVLIFTSDELAPTDEMTDSLSEELNENIEEIESGQKVVRRSSRFTNLN